MFSGVLSEAQAVMVTCSWVVEAMLDLKFHHVILEFSGTESCTTFSNKVISGSAFGPWIQTMYNLLSSFEISHLSYVSVGGNLIAMEISDSVIRDRRRQSYVANQGIL
ncbi:hypothetical protein HA466_0239810 [Hirschfeldia incana]|nr:hypothetical protein HA466_0239810 [Hirschfeldia incana]